MDEILWKLQIGLTTAEKRHAHAILSSAQSTRTGSLFECAKSDEDSLQNPALRDTLNTRDTLWHRASHSGLSGCHSAELKELLARAETRIGQRNSRVKARVAEQECVIGDFRLIHEYQKPVLPGRPLALSLKGNPAVLRMPSIAIIGSRLPTFAGRQLAWTMAHDLARAGFVIWSGGAIGIDAVAIKGAFEAHSERNKRSKAVASTAGTTAAMVLGSGLDIPYPPSNLDIFRHDGVTLVSEFAFEQRAQPYCFPMRNFTLAWLVDYVVVIESQKNSGSLITADCAAALGKNVGAVAWPEGHPLGSGNQLLLESGADSISSADDVISCMRRAPGAESLRARTEGTERVADRTAGQTLT